MINLREKRIEYGREKRLGTTIFHCRSCHKEQTMNIVPDNYLICDCCGELFISGRTIEEIVNMEA